MTTIDERKTAERHYYLKPISVTRVVARRPQREIVGWKFEVLDGWGKLLIEGTRVYKTQAEALEAARDEPQ